MALQKREEKNHRRKVYGRWRAGTERLQVDVFQWQSLLFIRLL
jgi:hypothetical protein